MGIFRWLVLGCVCVGVGTSLRNGLLSSGVYRRLRNGRMVAAERPPPEKRGAPMRSRLGAPGGICEKSEWRNSRRLANPKDSLPYYCNISEDIPIIAIFG